MQTKFMKIAMYVLAAAWSWSMSFVLPIGHFLVLTLVLVVCDFVTGVRAARHRGEVIQSRGFRRTTWKSVMYFIAILLSKGMEDVFGIPKLTYIVSGFIAITEFKSNLENVASFTGTDIWAHLVTRIPNLFKLPKGKD